MRTIVRTAGAWTLPAALVFGALWVCGPRLSAQQPADGGTRSRAAGDETTDDLLRGAALRDPGLTVREMPLSLDAALSLALTREFTLRIAGLDPVIRATEVTAAESAFDFVLSGSTRFGRNVRGTPPSGFVGSQEDDWTHSFSLTRQFDVGMSANLTWTYRKFESDNIFQTTTDSGGLALTLTQNLFRDMGRGPSTYEVEVAEVAQASADSAAVAARQQTLASVEQAYWQLVFAVEDLKVVQDAVALAADEVRLEERRREQGLSTPINIHAARANLANQRRDVIEKVRAVLDQSDALLGLIQPADLMSLLSRGQIIVIVPTDRLSDAPTPAAQIDVRAELRRALANREEVRQAALALNSADLTRKYQENQALVDLDFSTGLTIGGSGSKPGQALDRIFLQADTTEWFVSLELSYPFGNRAAEARREKGALEYQKAAIALEQAQVAVIQEVLAAVRGVYAAHQTLEASLIAERLATRQYEAERLREREGKATRYTVRQFENDLKQRRRDTLSARVGIKNAELALRQTTGLLGRERKAEGIPAGIPGGIPGGIPEGIPEGIPGGIPEGNTP